MGNQLSGDDAGNSLPPRMVLTLDAFSIPYGTTFVQSQQSMEPEAEAVADEVNSPRGMSGPLMEEFWCTRVLVDGKDIAGGRVYNYPSNAITIEADTWGAQLQLQFYATPTELTPRALISISLQKLLGFGAPLYTSLWLGLKISSRVGDDDLSDALTRAYEPDAAKVKITLFRPAGNYLDHGLPAEHSSMSDVLRPDVQGLLEDDTGFDTCMGPDGCNKTATSKPNQIEGLINCLSETNALIKEHHEAVMLKPVREKLSRDLQRAKSLLSEARDKRAADTRNREAMIETLRRELSEIRARNGGMMQELKQQQYLELQAKAQEVLATKDKFEEELSNIHSQQLAHLGKTRAELDVKTADATAQESLRVARSKWEAESKAQIAEAVTSWQERVEQEMTNLENSLNHERAQYQADTSMLRIEAAKLKGEISAMDVDIEQFSSMRGESTTALAEMRVRFEQDHAAAVADGKRRIEEQRAASEQVKQQQEHELEETNAKLTQFAQKLEEELDAIKACHLKDAVELAKLKHAQENARVMEFERRQSALEAEHRTNLHQQHAQWEQACGQYEQQIAILQEDMNQEYDEITSLILKTEDKRTELASLQKELPTLRERAVELSKTIPRLEEDSNQALATARTEMEKAQIAYDQKVIELRLMKEAKLRSSSEDHIVAVQDCKDECGFLRRELESLKEDSAQQCEDIAKSWEGKLTSLGDAFALACVGLKSAEDDGEKALEALSLEGQQRLEALVSQREAEASEIRERIAAETRSAKETQAQLSSDIYRLEEKGIQDEEKLIAENQRRVEDLQGDKTASLKLKEEELQKQIDDVRSQRDTILADKQTHHQEQEERLTVEMAHLKETVSTLAETRRDNSNLASELEMVRTRAAELGNLRNACAEEVADASTTLDAVREELGTTKRQIQEKEASLQKVLNELQDIRSMQDRGLIEAEQEKQRLEEEAVIEMNRLQRDIEELQTDAPGRLSDELRDFEAERLPEMETLQSQVDDLLKQLVQQKMSFANSEKEHKSKAEAQLNDVVAEKRETLSGLKKIKDDEVMFRQESEEKSRKQKREADIALAAAQHQVEQEMRAQGKASKEGLQLQEDKHAELLNQLKNDHEIERNRIRNLLPEHEKAVDVLHDKIVAAEASKSSLVSEVEILTADLQRFNRQHAEEISRSNARHNETIDKESQKADSGYAQLQKQISDRRDSLSEQLAEARREAVATSSELEQLRSQIDAENADATSKDESFHQQIAVLTAKLDAVDKELQGELSKGEELVEIANLRLTNHENKAKRLADDSTAASERLTMEIESVQAEIDDSSVQIKDSREELTTRKQEFEQERVQELDFVAKRFKQETETNEMTHKLHLEGSSLAFDAALQAEQTEHLQEVKVIRSEIAGLETKVERLEPYIQELEVTRRTIASTRERIEELEISRQSEEAQSVELREQDAARMSEKHVISLQLERESFETALQQHNERSGVSLKALKDEVDAADQDFQQQLAALEDELNDLEQSGREREAALERRRADEFAIVGEAADKQARVLQKELEDLTNSCEEIRKAEEALEFDVTRKTEAQLHAVASCLDERIQKARAEARQYVKSQFSEDKLINEEELAQLRREDSSRKSQAEQDQQQRRQAHEREIQDIRARVVRDAEATKIAHAELEKRATSTKSILEQMQGTAEATQKAHELELQMCDEALKTALEDLTLQEEDNHRELLRELADTQRTCEASLRKARTECEALAEKVRQDAMYDADKRIEAIGAKMKKEVTKLQTGAADLHNRYDRAAAVLERFQKKEDIKKGNLRSMKDINEKSSGKGRIPGSSGSLSGRSNSKRNLGDGQSARGPALTRVGSSKGFSALESPVDRMVLEMFANLLLERCGTLNVVEADQRFETLRSGSAKAVGDLVPVSFADFSRAITRVLASRRQCNLAEAFRVVMAQIPQGQRMDFQTALRKTLGLEEELFGHVCFLIDSALRQSRQAAGKFGAMLDELITEDEFVSMFSDSRLGQTE